MLQTIVVIERGGLDAQTLMLQFDVPTKDFDLITAVKSAATDYCKTKEGKEVYKYNCRCFNWADFEMNVPNEFCEKYGFKMIDGDLADLEVDWDEQLVDDDEICDEED